MVTQSGDPNNKSKPAYRKYCSYCHKNNHSITNCYQKQRDDEYQKYKPKDHELLNNLLYNISAVNLTIHKKIEMTIQILNPPIMIVTNIIKIIIMRDTEIMIDIVAIVENFRKTTTELILDKDIIIDLEAHIDFDLIIIIKEELHLDLHIDLHIETIPITGITIAQDTDLVLNHKEVPLNDIIIRIDLHQDLEISDHDLEHPHETDHKTE